jgi:hypothetical protein
VLAFMRLGLTMEYRGVPNCKSSHRLNPQVLGLQVYMDTSSCSDIKLNLITIWLKKPCLMLELGQISYITYVKYVLHTYLIIYVKYILNEPFFILISRIVVILSSGCFDYLMNIYITLWYPGFKMARKMSFFTTVCTFCTILCTEDSTITWSNKCMDKWS